MKNLWLILSIIFMFGACRSTEDKGELVAEVYGAKLYEQDFQELFHDGMSQEDSIFIRKEFINQWVARQVVLHKSKEVLTPRELDKSQQVKAYENDLIAYETLNKLVVERADSLFSEDSLYAYYLTNQKEFELSQNIIKLIFVKLPVSLEDLDEWWEKFRQSNVNLLELKNLAIEHRGNYSIDTSSWVYFNDVLKEIPIQTYNQEHYLNNNNLIRINEGSFVYFVRILDYRVKSDQSPFEMEHERIRKILHLKQQEQALIDIERELLEQAYNQNKIVIH